MMHMRTLYILLFCLPFLFSCEMKKDLLGGGKESEDEKPTYENVGMLDLKLKPEKEAKAPGTKVDNDLMEDELNPNDFTVAILDSIGQTVKAFDSYADMNEDGALLLPAGKYSIKASSGTDLNAGYDSPYYVGDTTCVVSEKEVVTVVAKCKLGNKKVQFLCDADFLAQFSDDYYIVIDNGAGVLTLTRDEKRIAYLKDTGTLRFTMYTTTHDNKSRTYSYDLSKEDLIQSHNNILISLGTIPADPDNPGGGGGNNPSDPDEPEVPDDPEEPENPEKPEIPVKGPVIKVDVSLIEKDYVIEIPSDFVESDKPDTPGGGDNTGGGENPDEQKKIAITGSLDGKSFNLGATQAVTSSSKVVINLYLPTGLAGLDVYVEIGSEIKLPLDLLDSASIAEVNGILAGLGKKLTVPSKGEKGNLKFDISPFMGMLDTNNSFKVSLKDKNGESTSATIKLTKK